MQESPGPPATTHRPGDFDYETHGHGYAQQRRPDPRIAARVHRALGPSRTVLNVGAGAGSYEPEDRYVLPIEPSATMRSQRPQHLRPAVVGVAERLPLGDRSVDASMATLTVHQWRNLERGLGELRRVTRGPVVIMTFDGDALDRFWLARYAPELIAAERRRYPPIDRIRACLGGRTEVQPVPVPLDCVDGFGEAYYARPERFLDPAVRRSQSGWGFVDGAAEARFADTLAADLESGAWDRDFGEWRHRPVFEGALRLIVRHSAEDGQLEAL
jgi:SAM-dependent methyltransferase